MYFRTANQPENAPKCDLQSKSKSAEYIGFEIKITNQKRISNHDFKYFDLKSSPSLHINYCSLNYPVAEWSVFSLCVVVFILVCVFLFLYSIRTKLKRFNYFNYITIISTPLCVVTGMASVAGSFKVAVVLSNLLL